MTAALPPLGRLLRSPEEVGTYDAVYVSPRPYDAPLSCTGRLVTEALRGLRALLVVVFGEAQEPQLFADQICLGFPEIGSAGDEDPASETDLEEFSPSLVAEIAPRLEDIFRRARARSFLFPLGVGGHKDSIVAHEAALRTFHAGAGRDVYLYEERPEALVSGSVRVRLGQLGARLPPAAFRVRGEGGLLRFLLQLQTVPRARDAGKGLKRRLRRTRRSARQWFKARAWKPSRALGPRLQPLVNVPGAKALEPMHAVLTAVGASLGPRTAERLFALSADHARRLGASSWAERYWLLLPERTGSFAAAHDLEEATALD